MVSFALRRPGKAKEATPELEDEDAASTSSSSLNESAVGPSTPDGVSAAAALGGVASKYWPTPEEVAEVLDKLSEDDRALCDAAMANRCGCGPAAGLGFRSRGCNAPRWADAAADHTCGMPHAACAQHAGPSPPLPSLAVALLPLKTPLTSTACLPRRNQLSSLPPARYLRATSGEQRHAAKRIADTLAWRRAEQPEAIVCTACRANHKSHYMQVVGHDLAGRCVRGEGLLGVGGGSRQGGGAWTC